MLTLLMSIALFTFYENCPIQLNYRGDYYFCHFDPNMDIQSEIEQCENLTNKESQTETIIYPAHCFEDIHSTESLYNIRLIRYFDNLNPFNITLKNYAMGTIEPRNIVPVSSSVEAKIDAICEMEKNDQHVYLDLSYDQNITIECRNPTTESYTFLKYQRLEEYDDNLAQNSERITVSKNSGDSKLSLFIDDFDFLYHFIPTGFKKIYLPYTQILNFVKISKFKTINYEINIIPINSDIELDPYETIFSELSNLISFQISSNNSKIVFTSYGFDISVSAYSNGNEVMTNYKVKCSLFNFNFMLMNMNSGGIESPFYCSIECQNETILQKKKNVDLFYQDNSVNLMIKDGPWKSSHYNIYVTVDYMKKRSVLNVFGDIIYNLLTRSDLHLILHVPELIIENQLISASEGQSTGFHITNAYSTTIPVEIKIRHFIIIDPAGINFMQENFPVKLTFGNVFAENLNTNINFLNGIEYQITSSLTINQTFWTTDIPNNELSDQILSYKNVNQSEILHLESKPSVHKNYTNKIAKSLSTENLLSSDFSFLTSKFNSGNLVVGDQTALFLTFNGNFHLNNSISFPGNQYFLIPHVPEGESVELTQNEQFLCQDNLDCEKFDLVMNDDKYFRGEDKDKIGFKNGRERFTKTCTPNGIEKCVGYKVNFGSLTQYAEFADDLSIENDEELKYWRWKDIVRNDKNTNIRVLELKSTTNKHLFNLDTLEQSSLTVQTELSSVRHDLSIMLSSHSIPKILNLLVQKGTILHLYKYQQSFPGLELDEFVFDGTFFADQKPFKMVKTVNTIKLSAINIKFFEDDGIDLANNIYIYDYEMQEMIKNQLDSNINIKPYGFKLSKDKIAQKYIRDDKLEEKILIKNRTKSNFTSLKAKWTKEIDICDMDITEKIPFTTLDFESNIKIRLVSEDSSYAKNLEITSNVDYIELTKDNNVYLNFNSIGLNINTSKDTEIHFFGNVFITDNIIFVPEMVKGIIFENLTMNSNSIRVFCAKSDGTSMDECIKPITIKSFQLNPQTRDLIDLNLGVIKESDTLVLKSNFNEVVLYYSSARNKALKFILDYSIGIKEILETSRDLITYNRPEVLGFPEYRTNVQILGDYVPVIYFHRSSFNCQKFLEKNTISFSHNNHYIYGNNQSVSYEYECFENISYEDYNNKNLRVNYSWKINEITNPYSCIAVKESRIGVENPFKIKVKTTTQPSKSLSGGAIAGIVIGVLALIIIIVLVLLIFVFHLIKCGNRDPEKSSSIEDNNKPSEDS